MSVRGEDRHALLTAAKPRKVLALLLLHANQVVPAMTLVRELWNEGPPPSASTTLQTYILRLRLAFSETLQVPRQEIVTERLLTCPGGYLLRVAPGELDVHRFEQLTAEGRRALSVGDNDAAAILLGDALSLWQGPALVDVPAGPLLSTHVARLDENRLTAMQQRIEAWLRLGHHHEMLAELAALVAQHPLHEILHAQFMLALYRSGRRPHALDLFQRLRTALISELGLEPSAKMQRLHHAILVADPVLDGPERSDAMGLDRIFMLHRVA